MVVNALNQHIQGTWSTGGSGVEMAAPLLRVRGTVATGVGLCRAREALELEPH